jgi:hypothetical protein
MGAGMNKESRESEKSMVHQTSDHDETVHGVNESTNENGKEEKIPKENRHPANTRKSEKMFLAAAAMMVVAIALCILIWRITHTDEKDNVLANNQMVSGTSITHEDDTQNNGANPSQEGDTQNNGTNPSQEGHTQNNGTNPSQGGDTQNNGTNPSQEGAPQNNGANTSQEGISQTSGTGITQTGATNTDTSDPAILNMMFEECNETVTAKDLVNLRIEPSTTREESILAQLTNGETIIRTGVNPQTGWSRLEYQGESVYAVTSLLTTILTKTNAEAIPAQGNATAEFEDPNVVTTTGGRTIVFTSCEETVSAKIKANLRLEPSTLAGNDTIHISLEYGQTATRTGISPETGWSRLEFDGKTLYAVSSLLYLVEETDETD